MNASVFRVLSEVFRDIAQVFFASAVVPQIFNFEAARNWFSFGWGSAIALVFWGLAVTMGWKGKI